MKLIQAMKLVASFALIIAAVCIIAIGAKHASNQRQPAAQIVREAVPERFKEVSREMHGTIAFTVYQDTQRGDGFLVIKDIYQYPVSVTRIAP